MGKWLFRQVMRMQVFMYRYSGGRLMGSLRGMPLLILTTVGRKSGKVRETPVMYLQDGANYVVTASNAGDDAHPGWFVNLRAHPEATIAVGNTTLHVTANVAVSDERARLWATLVEKAPFFAQYQKNTTREIPVVVLTPSNGRLIN